MFGVCRQFNPLCVKDFLPLFTYQIKHGSWWNSYQTSIDFSHFTMLNTAVKNRCSFCNMTGIILNTNFIILSLSSFWKVPMVLYILWDHFLSKDKSTVVHIRSANILKSSSLHFTWKFWSLRHSQSTSTWSIKLDTKPNRWYCLPAAKIVQGVWHLLNSFPSLC